MDEDLIISVDSPPDETALKSSNQNGAYVWEEQYKRSWDVLQEDEDGLIQNSVSSLANQLKRKRCVL
jgi:transcription initiation factor TFIIH subunit 2